MDYTRQAGLLPIATAELPTIPSRPKNAVPDATELAVRVQTIPDVVLPAAQAAPAPPCRARAAPDVPYPLLIKLHQRSLFVSGILQTAWLLVAKLRLINQVVCMLFRRLQNYLLVCVLFRMVQSG
ncbi:hypothetical protein DVH05_013757 [Phytophthora capsici]|nr:hypothetical protein DVH05_013757 [Phytophthora capsici]